MSNETTANETMLNETMLKTADMMSDTNECVPCRTHKHAAKCQYPPWLLARPCRENAMQETKDAMSIDAMQKTKTTMNDASECVPPTPCGSHAPSRMCTQAA